ncbi:bactofilin family protein [Tessaracoccus sp. Y36]
MKRLLSVAASAALALTGLAVTAQTAAADVTCTGTLSGRNVGDDNVIVPAGASCTLTDVTTQGNVILGAGSSVTINGGYVDGSVQAESKSPVSVVVRSGARVNGNIQVKYATGAVTINGARVGGDVQLFENRAAISVNNNVVDGNLQCKENLPAPTGAGNVVKGSAEDQCRGLTGTAPAPSPSPSAPAVDIYITPGEHLVNGRRWRTVCEPYSATERCRTEIQATIVKWDDGDDDDRGRFVQVNGWAFNNLTYKATARSIWKNNPLAANGVVGGRYTWTDGGRTWRTECDTALTGRNGCRTYASADVVENRGGRYVWVEKEILNNMVRFN